MINEELEERAKALGQQHQTALEDYNRTAVFTDEAASHHHRAQSALIDQLALLRATVARRVALINQAHDHYTAELRSLGRGRLYAPPVAPGPQVSQLSMEMGTLLKFDALSRKRAKLEAEFQAACSRLKDEVKKVKLKISLTELEINEAQKKSAKKSVKY